MGWSKAQFPCLGKDMTLGQAMQASAVPVYQELARRIGLDLMQKKYSALDMAINRLAPLSIILRLVGPLQITPVQEVLLWRSWPIRNSLLSQMCNIPVQDMLLIEQNRIINSTQIWLGHGPRTASRLVDRLGRNSNR